MPEGNRIFLRKVEPRDKEKLLVWENDPAHWLVSGTRAPYSSETIDIFIRSTQDLFLTGQLRLLACLTSTNEAVGAIDLFAFEPVHLNAGVGILIDKNFQKKGLATESLNQLDVYCRENFSLKNLWCNVLSENVASLKLFSTCGYREVGVKKAWFNNGENWLDEYFYQKEL